MYFSSHTHVLILQATRTGGAVQGGVGELITLDVSLLPSIAELIKYSYFKNLILIKILQSK